MADLNRLKVVLVEKKETLSIIAKILDADIKELLVPTLHKEHIS